MLLNFVLRPYLVPLWALLVSAFLLTACAASIPPVEHGPCQGGHSARVTGLFFDRSGERLFSTDHSTTKVWDVASGQCVAELNISTGPVAVDPVSNRVALLRGDGIALVSLDSFEVERALPCGAGSASSCSVDRMVFSADGSRLAVHLVSSGGKDERTLVYEVEQGIVLADFRDTGADMVFDASGEVLYVSSSGAVILQACELRAAACRSVVEGESSDGYHELVGLGRALTGSIVFMERDERELSVLKHDTLQPVFETGLEDLTRGFVMNANGDVMLLELGHGKVHPFRLYDANNPPAAVTNTGDCDARLEEELAAEDPDAWAHFGTCVQLSSSEGEAGDAELREICLESNGERSALEEQELLDAYGQAFLEEYQAFCPSFLDQSGTGQRVSAVGFDDCLALSADGNRYAGARGDDLLVLSVPPPEAPFELAAVQALARMDGLLDDEVSAPFEDDDAYVEDGGWDDDEPYSDDSSSDGSVEDSSPSDSYTGSYSDDSYSNDSSGSYSDDASSSGSEQPATMDGLWTCTIHIDYGLGEYRKVTGVLAEQEGERVRFWGSWGQHTPDGWVDTYFNYSCNLDGSDENGEWRSVLGQGSVIGLSCERE